MTGKKRGKKMKAVNQINAKAWAIVTKKGKFADGRAGYALFSSRADAQKWFIDDDDDRIARIELREIPAARRK